MTQSNKKYTYAKAERLKSKKTIDRLFTEGKSIFKYPIKLVYLPIDKSDVPVYFAPSVSKRLFKTAVKRNRIKRLIREAYRLNKFVLWDDLEGQPYAYAVMAIYVGKEELPLSSIEKSLVKIMRKMVASIS